MINTNETNYSEISSVTFNMIHFYLYIGRFTYYLKFINLGDDVLFDYIYKYDFGFE